MFGVMRVSATKALRELRVEELTVPGADRLLDDVLAIEKAMAGLKVLLRRPGHRGPRCGGVYKGCGGGSTTPRRAVARVVRRTILMTIREQGRGTEGSIVGGGDEVIDAVMAA